MNHLCLLLQVYEFFQKRIALQYPLEQTQLDPYQHVKEQHEAFMKSRCDFVFGRDDVLKQVMLVEQERKNGLVRNATMQYKDSTQIYISLSTRVIWASSPSSFVQ